MSSSTPQNSATSFSPVPASELSHPRRERSNRARKIRSTYNYENAQRFLYTLDRMIETSEDQAILTSAAGCSITTLYLKSNDALKWLCDTPLPEYEKYRELRRRIRISPQEDRVVFYFKRGLIPLQCEPPIGSVVPIPSSPLTPNLWKESFSKWLEVAQSGELWDSREKFPLGLGWTKDEKNWVVQILSGLEGVEMEMGENYLRVMR